MSVLERLNTKKKVGPYLTLVIEAILLTNTLAIAKVFD